LAIAAAAAAAVLAGTPANAAIRAQTVATGMVVPWEIAFMPNGSAFVTERPGRVRLLDRRGHLVRRPVARIRVTNQGEGGLLGLALDPAFAHNRLVYLYFTSGASMELERRRWTGRRLVRERSLVAGIRAGDVHDSGRIEFGPDRRLYISTGDAGEPMLAQDPNSLNGKFLAMTPHQYRGVGGRPSVVSMGNRNAQGFDWQPGTGSLISTEHGPTGFDGPECCDEINDIRQGGNYGWPLVIGSGHPGFVDPLKVYQAPIAPSGATFITHPGSRWTGNFIFACLRGQELRRLVFRGSQIVHDEQLFVGRYGRLRDVVEGPRGALYVLTSNRDGRGRPRPGDDKILRIVPPRR
jgi:glucose/arabinose dehydrogenase